MHPNAQTSFMLNQKSAQYASSLNSWARQVTGTHSTMDALRIASHRPNPDSLIRAIRSLWSNEKLRADTQVERNLLERVAKVSPQDPQLLTMMRLAQGHWPTVWRQLDALRKKRAEPKSPATRDSLEDET